MRSIKTVNYGLVYAFVIERGLALLCPVTALSKNSAHRGPAAGRRLASLLLALIVIVGGGRAFAGVCASGSVLEGVDVSLYEGAIDWSQVQGSGRAFAFTRVSDGISDVDSTFDTNYAAIKSAGMIRGAYQFFEPAQDPLAQANLLLSKIGALRPGDLPPFLDVEITGGQSPATIAANIQLWMSTVEQATGVTPMIYTSAGFWDGSIGSSGFASNPLFVANWGVTCPSLPSPWTNWQFWQYSGTGTVPGISTAGAVDLDRFNGSMSDLTLLAAGSPLNFVGAASRKVHGAAGTFDLSLSLVMPPNINHNPTTEPRIGPTQTIVFTFDRAISGATVNVTEGVATAAAPTFSGNDVIVALTGVADRQFVTVSLTSVSSSDGGTGGSAAVRLGFLTGDVNSSRLVAVTDLVVVNNQLGKPLTALNFLSDVNASGIITVLDKVVVNNTLGHFLPAP